MQSTPSARARRLGAITVAAILAILGVGAIIKGVDGRSTVRSALRLEGVVGAPHMTPRAIAVKAKQAGLRDVALPDCSVAGKPIEDGARARCFAQYMRIDALMATHGATYAQMPRFATEDGKGTNDLALAKLDSDGQRVNNPARQVWVTETALSTALNTSYMAEQISLFGIAIGAALLLIGLTLGIIATAGLRLPSPAFKRTRTQNAAASDADVR